MTSTKPVPATQQPTKAPAQAATQAPAAKAKKRVLSDADRARIQQERAAKFLELARPRLGRVLKAMKQLENLGRGQYVYTTAQADNLLRHLVEGVGRVKVAFAPKVRGSAAAQELPEL